jgi:hypothetical protein
MFGFGSKDNEIKEGKIEPNFLISSYKPLLFFDTVGFKDPISFTKKDFKDEVLDYKKKSKDVVYNIYEYVIRETDIVYYIL